MSEDIRSIEIPHKRIIEMSARHFEQNFRRMNANGDTPNYGEATYMAVRYRDGRVFKMAEFVPAERTTANMDYVYLEEL